MTPDDPRSPASELSAGGLGAYTHHWTSSFAHGDIYSYIYTCIYVHIYIYIYIYRVNPILSRVNPNPCSSGSDPGRPALPRYICIYVYTYMYIHIYMYVHACIYIHIYIYLVNSILSPHMHCCASGSDTGRPALPRVRIVCWRAGRLHPPLDILLRSRRTYQRRAQLAHRRAAHADRAGLHVDHVLDSAVLGQRCLPYTKETAGKLYVYIYIDFNTYICIYIYKYRYIYIYIYVYIYIIYVYIYVYIYIYIHIYMYIYICIATCPPPCCSR